MDDICPGWDEKIGDDSGCRIQDVYPAHAVPAGRIQDSGKEQVGRIFVHRSEFSV